jgi:mono/diheme cytochrome c family protein
MRTGGIKRVGHWPYNNRGLWTILFLLPVLSSCKSRPPGTLETSVALFTKRHLTVGGKKESSPFPTSIENIDAGRRNFRNYCMVCHGLDGQNTGVPFADRMSPPVPPLSSPAVQSYSDGQLKWIIDNGISPSGMPASHGILNDDEIWQIVQYVRHLPAKGSLGEPAVYSGESPQRTTQSSPETSGKSAMQ